MKVITLASPDKISIGMFTTFFIKAVGKEHKILDTHSLMSPVAIQNFVKDSRDQFEKILFRYYAKKKINKKPEDVIPQELMESSGLILWFSLYSTEPKIIKDENDNFKRLYQPKWAAFVAAMNKGG